MFAIFAQKLTERRKYPCSQDVKEPAYKELVRPVLECGRFVWDPQGVVFISNNTDVSVQWLTVC